MTQAELKMKFSKRHPGKFFLDGEQIEPLEQYLKEKGWLSNIDSIQRVEKPGEGNMNCVLRIIPSVAPSFVVKQSRPWVEKYPQIDAPIERIFVEHTYYQAISKNAALAAFTPEILGFEENDFLLVLEDLGAAKDYTFAYQANRTIDPSEIHSFIGYLNILNHLEIEEDYPKNRDLRALNHQHIFYLPFLPDNGFDLDGIQEGLQKIATVCQTDKVLKQRVEELGKVYLSDQDTLLHGDFYPGSLLNAGGVLKVIDPEFSFLGPGEWDIAVFIAHLFMIQTDITVINAALQRYEQNKGFDEGLFAGFVGTEILRRLIGLAQLPLEMSLSAKKELIMQARDMVKTGRVGGVTF